MTISVRITEENLAMIVGQKAAAYLFPHVEADDLDAVFDLIDGSANIAITAMYLPIAKELRESLSFDAFIFSKSIPTFENNFNGDEPALLYHSGFMFGTVKDFIAATTLPSNSFHIMDYYTFEDEFLGELVE